MITHVAILTGAGMAYINTVGIFHPGYFPGLLGACIMTFRMFVSGLIGGAALAYIYNYFAKEEKSV